MINSEIRMIQHRLQEAIAPVRIYLFGSYAKDTYRPDSDYDFYLVMPDESGDQIAVSQQAYRALRGIRKTPVDIVVGKESTFRRRAQENTLERIVHQEGIVLYERQ